MKPKLYLHIGHSKVASSSIQAYIDANIDAIRAAGFLVADVDGQFPTRGPIFSCPVGMLQQAWQSGAQGVEIVNERMRELLRLLQGGRFDKAIVSAENLCNPRFELMFVEASRLFEIHLIYYIRRQDEWLVSAWKQWGIKSGKSLKEFCMHGVQTRYPAFTHAIRRWEPMAATMHVRPLHASALAGGSVTSDFATALGLDPGRLREVGVANPSFDAAVLDVLRRNPFLFEHTDDNRMFDFLTEFLPAEIQPMRPVLDAETRGSICRYFEAENRELCRRFFPDVDFERIFGAQAHNGSQQPVPPQDLLYRYLGLQLRALMDMHHELRELRQRLEERT